MKEEQRRFALVVQPNRLQVLIRLNNTRGRYLSSPLSSLSSFLPSLSLSRSPRRRIFEKAPPIYL